MHLSALSHKFCMLEGARGQNAFLPEIMLHVSMWSNSVISGSQRHTKTEAQT